MIAAEIDESRPSGSQWHRDLLAQMVLSVPGVRPAVIVPETQAALGDYLEFRHVVRNVYTFNLRTERVVELTRDMRKTFEFCRNDLLAFAAFLQKLSTADQEED